MPPSSGALNSDVPARILLSQRFRTLLVSPLSIASGIGAATVRARVSWAGVDLEWRHHRILHGIWEGRRESDR
jgi:hypothetical protein